MNRLNYILDMCNLLDIEDILVECYDNNIKYKYGLSYINNMCLNISFKYEDVHNISICNNSLNVIKRRLKSAKYKYDITISYNIISIKIVLNISKRDLLVNIILNDILKLYEGEHYDIYDNKILFKDPSVYDLILDSYSGIFYNSIYNCLLGSDNLVICDDSTILSYFRYDNNMLSISIEPYHNLDKIYNYIPSCDN